MAKANDESGFIDLVFEELTPEEMNSRAESFYQEMNKRRTTRHFSTRDVPQSLIEAAIKTAGTAPSVSSILQTMTFSLNFALNSFCPGVQIGRAHV